MALGSRESEERRKRQRAQEKMSREAAYKRAKATTTEVFDRMVNRHGVAYGEKVLRALYLYESLAWSAKDPPELFQANLHRIIHGQEPIQVRDADVNPRRHAGRGEGGRRPLTSRPVARRYLSRRGPRKPLR